MTSRHLLNLLSLSLWLLALPAARAQTADDFFHGGAMFYLSNNVPSAKDVVTNGLQRFPDDAKLKKLWELLNQQQQQQSQKDEQKQQEQKQEEKKPDQPQDKKDQSQQDQSQNQPQPKSEENKPDEPPRPDQAHAMTPKEAQQLLDGQKGEEKVLQFRPQGETKRRDKKLKDW